MIRRLGFCSRPLILRSAALTATLFAAPALVSALVVNTLAVDDDGACATSPGDCTLPEAINAANLVAGTDAITFTIPGPGPFIIKPTAALPTITSVVNINGTTQTGFVSTPIVVLDGSLVATANGLIFGAGSGGSSVRGLSIGRFVGAANGNGIVLISGGNTIVGNYIGVDPDGTTDAGNAVHGIVVSSSGNTIGGSTTADRNVISGNGNSGVIILPVTSLGSTEADDNKVIGNYIGTNAAGTAAVPNSTRGVGILNGQDNLIGDPMNPATGNLISGNTVQGLLVLTFNAPSTAVTRPADRNSIAFNKVGTNAAGTAAIANGNSPTGTGINIQGNDNSVLDNLVSGNVSAGIFVGRDSASTFAPANGNIIRRNRVGTNAAGTVALPNTVVGILLLGASNTTVGGTTAQGNVVSGNGGNGISVNAFTANLSSSNTISGNLIGVNAAGTVAMPNGAAGQTALGVGGNSDGNTISGNVIGAASTGGHGIAITGGSDNNIVSNNFIGTDSGGTLNFGNADSGVFLNGVNGTTISGNLIARNGVNGVRVMDTDGLATGNKISANRIRDNTGIGIDLGADGVTPNDPLDPDTGPNFRLNFPEITTAEKIAGNMLMVAGDLDNPAGTYTIEIFASVSCDPTGHGEGAIYLGSLATATDSFSGSVPYSLSSGPQITATATDATGNTSEFSACFTALVGYLDVDLDGEVTPLTDGRLVIRHLFGLTGSALTSGSAVDGDCTRCLATDITAYLASIQPILDIDGNGSTKALSDGMLTLRFLFDLSGTALTSGAVGPSCTRCTPTAIEDYLTTLLPPP